MGKSSNSQPKHDALNVGPIKHNGRRRGSKSGSRQRHSIFPTKSSAPSAANELVSQPSSPSPLIVSLSSDEPIDVNGDISVPSSPVSDMDIDMGEDEDEEVFYDADDGLSEPPKPVLASVQQVGSESDDEGAAKGLAGGGKRRPGPGARNTAVQIPPSSTSCPLDAHNYKFGSTRGSAKPAATPAPGPAVATLVAEEALKAAPPPPVPPPRPAVMKALAVGFNYDTFPEDKRLRYAVRDAKLWQKTFLDKGIPPENIVVFTDEVPAAATHEALRACIRWLVQDTRAGDSLFFAYSGHAIQTAFNGPSILTPDKVLFPRPLLEHELVMAVPKGADLQVVFDCCHSAGMISLQYCVGRMAVPASSSGPHAETSAACPLEPESQGSEHHTEVAPPRPSTPYSHAPQQASLYGIPAAADTTPQAAPAPPPVTPDMVGQETFGAPPQRHHRGGVMAAPPLSDAPAIPAGNQPGLVAGATSFFASIVSTLVPTSSPTPVPAPTQVTPEPFNAATVRPRAGQGQRRTQGVAEGTRMPDYFEARKGGFVTPAGTVMVWAGTGEKQQAFEASGRARQGVVTKAMCDALGVYTARGVGTCRELWSYLVQEIEGENDQRRARDASKSGYERFPPRVQHAELWVSQGDPFVPLTSAAPVLDRPML